MEKSPVGDRPFQGSLHSPEHQSIALQCRINAELAAAIKQVLAGNVPIEIPTAEAFKLRSMGLVKFQGNAVIPLCDLDRQYFGDRLNCSNLVQ